MITQPPKHESPPSRVFVDSPNGVRYCVSTGYRESSAINGPRWYYETMLFRIDGDEILGFDDQADAHSAAAAEANRDRLASQAAAGQYDPSIDDEIRKAYADIKALGLWAHSIETLAGELSPDERIAFYEASGESLLAGRRWYADNIGAFPRESKPTAAPKSSR